MSKKPKRKRRKVMAKQDLDLNVPLNIEIIGSDEDPCFGKLYDPREKECSRCGDSEICAIVMGQKNHLLRYQEEKNKSFKDLEETEIKDPVDKNVIRKSIRRRVRSMVKMKEDGISMDEVINDIFASYGKDGFTQSRIKKIIKNMVPNSNHLTLTQNKLKWQK